MWGTLGVYATARGRLLQVASDEIRWRQASWPNFINWANSALHIPSPYTKLLSKWITRPLWPASDFVSAGPEALTVAEGARLERF